MISANMYNYGRTLLAGVRGLRSWENRGQEREMGLTKNFATLLNIYNGNHR